MDSSTERMTVFADIVRKNSVIRAAYFFYDSAPGFIKSYLLILYGLKCYLSANWRGTRNPDLVFCAAYPNERVALGHIQHHLHGLTDSEIALSRFHCFRPDSLRALLAFLCQAIRFQRVASRLSRRFSFLPACRIFSTITYYARFRRLLEAKGAKAVFVANHYSPECLALAAAAHETGRKVFTTNHANGTWRSGYVPPLHSDLAVVTSASVLEAYAGASQRKLEALFIPQALPQRSMRRTTDLQGPLTVGIFLTALTDMARLHALVDRLQSNPRIGRILIRSHPVKIVNEDLTMLLARCADVEEALALPLSENASLCDFAICGNSTVSIDLLRGGLPVLYDPELDALAEDLHGYVSKGLLSPLPTRLDAAAFRSLDSFYGDPAWAAVMRHFDAGYQQDEVRMFEELNLVLRRILHSAPVSSASPRGRDMPTELPYPAALS